MNSEKLQKLHDFPWEENYPKLIAFADHILQTKSWNMKVIPKGHTAETIVQDAIDKVFNEQRNWEPGKGSLLMYLKWVIRSDISHLATSAANRSEIHSNNSEADTSEDEAFEEWVSQLSIHNTEVISPEDLIVNSETENERYAIARSKIDALLESCNGKPKLETIVFAIIEGNCPSKPQDLAIYLGISVEEANQRLRTLRRKAIKIRIEDQDEGK